VPNGEEQIMQPASVRGFRVPVGFLGVTALVFLAGAGGAHAQQQGGAMTSGGL
jgi:hypothetical protein